MNTGSLSMISLAEEGGIKLMNSWYYHAATGSKTTTTDIRLYTSERVKSVSSTTTTSLRANKIALP